MPNKISIFSHVHRARGNSFEVKQQNYEKSIEGEIDNRNRSTALEWSVIKDYSGAKTGLTSPSASAVVQNI